MTLRTFAATFRDPAGARIGFNIEAESWEQAESYLEDIGSTGRIEGEVVVQGEVETISQMGQA